MFLVQSFWRDEGFSYILAKKNVLEIIFLTAKDFNPPLYYLILHFWIKFFGNSEIFMRLLSLIFYLVIIYVSYLFIYEILKIKSKKSFIYLLLLIVNPVLVYYAFETRMYTLFASFATLSFYYFLKKNYRLYFIFTLLGLYTHYFMLFVVLTQLIYNYFENKKINDVIRPVFFFIPWLMFVLLQGQFFISSFWIDRMNLRALINLPGSLFLGYEGWKGITSEISFFSSIFLIVLISIYIKFLKHNKLFLLLFLWGVGVPLIIALISFVKPLFFPRYLIFSTVGLVFFLILLIEKFPKIIRLLVYLLLLILSVTYQIGQIKTRKKTDLRKPVREIKSLFKKGDRLYVINELDFFTAEYYFNENQVYIYNKPYESIPDYTGKVLIPKNKIATSLPIYPKKAFILKPDGSYLIQALF